MKKWALEYKPSPRAPWVPWVIIVGVPDELRAGDVTDRLESWTRWPQWDARREIGSSLRVTDVSNVIGVEHDGIPRNSWDDIAPGQIRMSVTLDGAQHARFTRAARASGATLAEWARSNLTSAADAQLVILMESKVRSQDLTPAVVLRWGDEAGELSPDEARVHAMHILATAEAAEHDAALCRYLTKRGWSPRDVGEILASLRESRGMGEL